MTTLDPPATETAAAEELSPRRAPDEAGSATGATRPGAPAPTGAGRPALTAAAIALLAMCLAASVTTYAWHGSTTSNHKELAASQARTAGAVVGSQELARQIERLSAGTAELRAQVDAGNVAMLATVDDRDLLRDQLTTTQAELDSLHAQISGAYATVLSQTETMALLTECMKGVGKVLNMAGVDPSGAVETLGWFFDVCSRADDAINGRG